MSLIDEVVIHFDENNFPFRLSLENEFVRNPKTILYINFDGRIHCSHNSIMSFVDDWLNGRYWVYMYNIAITKHLNRQHTLYDTL